VYFFIFFQKKVSFCWYMASHMGQYDLNLIGLVRRIPIKSAVNNNYLVSHMRNKSY